MNAAHIVGELSGPLAAELVQALGFPLTHRVVACMGPEATAALVAVSVSVRLTPLSVSAAVGRVCLKRRPPRDGSRGSG